MSESECDFLLEKVIPNDMTKAKLMYRLSSKSGFSASKFHQKVKNLNNTIFVCESDSGQRFGGINFLPWGPDSKGKETDKNMIFSLSKASVHPLRMNESGKYKNTRISSQAICYVEGKGPVMGEIDLVIGDKCHKEESCNSDLDTYELLGDEDPETYLAGSEKFKLKSFFIFKLE